MFGFQSDASLNNILKLLQMMMVVGMTAYVFGVIFFIIANQVSRLSYVFVI